MNKPIVGILTWREGKRFAEPAYFKRLLRAGHKLGMTVFLFSPADVNTRKRQVRGYTASQTGWMSSLYPWPDVVIDRYRYTPTQAFKDYVAFRKKGVFLYANNRLANKWKVHQVLWKDERMRRWLPETNEYSRTGLQAMLARHPLLYVKPSNGTGGRGILRLERGKNGYRLLGRDKERAKVESRPQNTDLLCKKVDRWVNKGMFVIQQGLRLELIDARSNDMRLLIQKDGNGEWSITGYGMRLGGKNSATANLHGGGKAVAVEPFLERHFGTDKAQAILAECRQLARQTAETIEAHFGRMIELGLDIGIDVHGKVWLIEVNPKPGREIFKELGKIAQYQQAIEKPLQYASYLANEKKRQRAEA